MRYILISLVLLVNTNLFGQVNSETEPNSLSGSIKSESVISKEISESTNQEAIANLSKQITNEGFEYQFISNRSFDELRKQRWEERFPLTFPYIIRFSMDVTTQNVIIVLSENHSVDELLILVQKFEFENYQIN